MTLSGNRKRQEFFMTTYVLINLELARALVGMAVLFVAAGFMGIGVGVGARNNAPLFGGSIIATLGAFPVLLFAVLSPGLIQRILQ
jgi:hypothetical protein